MNNESFRKNIGVTSPFLFTKTSADERKKGFTVRYIELVDSLIPACLAYLVLGNY